uniref:Transmembrane protein n=1 Tax=Porphyridium sordidum TaxID=28024 RepID=A0A1C9CE25_PORSO|nr:hypothetical protein Psor_161 [Porphyridium sordidum]AOM66636.1 hypothetical protein Psor_161 [Porphyridium sordidum]
MICLTNDICLFLLENDHYFLHTYCQRQLLSRRNLDKIRNNISWNRLVFKYIKEPHNIYENRYEIFYFNKNVLYSSYIQQLRTEEFFKLKSIQYIVIEIQDFIMPKVLNLIIYLGQLFVFIIGNLNILSRYSKKK